ncbi:MAG: serine/threonine protein kinase [Acidobacteriia bacterium]|nr:serine/threonine protein kinase [Terriglobia bacterium]
MPSLLNATIGEYRLVEFLGAGGMGEVYRALHTKLGRVVAIKILSDPGQDRSLLERSYNEARIQASLQHPAIAAFYGFYEYQGRPCILMEYIAGESLAERIRRQGALEITEALGILQRVTGAIAHIHQQGIIHRDLKSNNIKITPAGEVKILDFGIARAPHTARVTKIGAVIGTADNLAPEQLEGQEADTRSDVWALGVLMYEMLTGRLPFEGSNLPELYAKICSVQYPPASALNPLVSPTLERILQRCLRRDPNQRYPSASELHDELASLSDHTPKLGGHRRLGLWAGGAAAALVVLVLLLVWAGSPSAPSAPVQSSASAQDAQLKTITVDVVSGTAEVYRNDRRVGSTPFQLSARVGEKVELDLKQQGFQDLKVAFDVTERPTYSYTMQRSQD